MKKAMFIIFFLILMLSNAAVSASSQPSVICDEDTGSIIIDGLCDKALSGEMVTIGLYDKNNGSIPVYFDIDLIDEKGMYGFSFTYQPESGKNIIEDYLIRVNLSGTELYDGVEIRSGATVVIEKLKSVEKNLFADMLNQYADLLKIDKGMLSAFNNLSVKSNIIDIMQNTDLSTGEEYCGLLYDNIFFSATKNENPEVLFSFIVNMQEYLEINYSKYEKLQKELQLWVMQQIARQEYADKLAFLDKFKKALSDAQNKASSQNKDIGDGGGGSGGGGFSAVKPGTEVIGILPNDELSIAKEQATDEENVQKDFGDREDIPQWAYEPIYKLKEMSIISGDDKNNIYPNKNITRAEFVKMIVNAFKFESVEGATEFSDVDSKSWYSEYVKKASTAQIISGYEDNTFGADLFVTREDMCLILYKAANKTKDSLIMNYGDEAFGDESEISLYARFAVNTMKSNKIINGVSEGLFCPKNYSTRGEAAKIIYATLDLMGEIE